MAANLVWGIASPMALVASLCGCHGNTIAVYCDETNPCGTGELCSNHVCVASPGSTVLKNGFLTVGWPTTANFTEVAGPISPFARIHPSPCRRRSQLLQRPANNDERH
jgi:hypothetical protein